MTAERVAVGKTMGSSMWPIVLAGADIEVDFGRGRQVRLGDVVAVWSAELRQPMLHRIVAVCEDMVATQGDAAPVIDGWLFRSEVLGVAQGIILGRWQWRTCPIWLSSLVHRVLLVLLPHLRGALSWYRWIKRTVTA